MNDSEIKTAQDFLTVNHEDRDHQIVNVDLLIRRHGPEKVRDFLEQLNEDYRKKLKKLVRRNPGDPYLNDLVARRFRIQMAINTIRNAEKRRKAA